MTGDAIMSVMRKQRLNIDFRHETLYRDGILYENVINHNNNDSNNHDRNPPMPSLASHELPRGRDTLNKSLMVKSFLSELPNDRNLIILRLTLTSINAMIKGSVVVGIVVIGVFGVCPSRRRRLHRRRRR